MDIAFILMSILLLAMFCQWLAWKLRLPSIIFLLLAGMIMGPVSAKFFSIPGGILDPSHLFGNELFYSIVDITVSIVLFEGCMNLRIAEISGNGRVVRNLVTIGLAMTAIATTFLSHLLLNMPWRISALFGAITSVSGPTVIIPLLRSVQPTKRLADIIRWEGMLIDPLGAFLAAIVFSTITAISKFDVIAHVLSAVYSVITVGAIIGSIFGYLLGIALRRHWAPDYLNNLLALSCVVTAFVVSEHMVGGAGLLCVAIMGLIVGNMEDTHIDEVLDFKEHLSLMLISILFILLASSVSLTRLEGFLIPCTLLVLCLQFIVRPIVAFTCTIGSDLNWRERLLLGWIAPRGIVAAAVAALFSVKLIDYYHDPYYGHIVSLATFLVIIGTVSIQSLTSSFIAKILKISKPKPNGFLIVGANKLAREIAHALTSLHIPVVLADIGWHNTRNARIEGLNCYYGNPASEHADWSLDLIGVGNLLGLSSYDHVNTLSAIKYRREFGSDSVFILPADGTKEYRRLSSLNKRYSKQLFTANHTYEQLRDLLNEGGKIKTTKITETFGWQEYQNKYKERAIPLFALGPKMAISVFTPQDTIQVAPGWSVVSLII